MLRQSTSLETPKGSKYLKVTLTANWRLSKNSSFRVSGSTSCKKNQGTSACDSPGCFRMFPAICNHERPVHAMRIWCIRTSRSPVILTPVRAASRDLSDAAERNKVCSAFLRFSNRLCSIETPSKH